MAVYLVNALRRLGCVVDYVDRLLRQSMLQHLISSRLRDRGDGISHVQ